MVTRKDIVDSADPDRYTLEHLTNPKHVCFNDKLPLYLRKCDCSDTAYYPIEDRFAFPHIYESESDRRDNPVTAEDILKNCPNCPSEKNCLGKKIVENFPDDASNSFLDFQNF